MPKRSFAPVFFRCATVLLCLGLVGCGDETPTPEPNSTAAPINQIAVTLVVTQPPANPAANAAAPVAPSRMPGVSLNMPTNLATGSQEQPLPARAAPTDAPFWMGNPAHTLITFKDYARTGTLYAPVIKVYAVADLLAFNPLTRMRVEGLQAALQDRPSQPRGVVVVDLFNGTQVLQVQPTYLQFQGGRGVRYITQYDDGPAPVNNRELFYTYQGLTNDGQFYVSVILPISAAGLPEDGSVGGAQLGGALNAPEFQTYMRQIEGTLGALPADQFAPTLGQLDQLITSITIIR